MWNYKLVGRSANDWDELGEGAREFSLGVMKVCGRAGRACGGCLIGLGGLMLDGPGRGEVQGRLGLYTWV